MKVVVIGGGPAGMIAAGIAAQNGNEVILIEKMNSLGKKLLITGKGRCNITNSADISEFIENIPGNGNFMYSALYTFTNEDLLKLLKDYGLETKVERGNRIFPISDKSIDVLETLKKIMKKNDVNIKYNTKVNEILVKENKVIGVRIQNEVIKCDKVILATGGKSYPTTGSTGDGYSMSKKIGHTIKEPVGSLVPLETYEKYDLKGLSIKNAEIKLYDKSINKKIYSDFGEMIFTHFGISGPTILSSSCHLLRYKNVEEKLKNKDIKLTIDFKPALSNERLLSRINRDFEEIKNKMFKNSLDKLLPKKLIPVIIELSKIDENKKVCDISNKEKEVLINLLKKFEVTIKGFRPIEEAIITAGGINVKEINPSTMESKIVSGLYFAGEVIDVDAYTGGFNLQIAFSTGYLAGMLK